MTHRRLSMVPPGYTKRDIERHNREVAAASRPWYLCDFCSRPFADKKTCKTHEKHCAVSALVAEEMHHFKRKGRHVSRKQAIAIALSRARRLGLPVRRKRR